MNPRSHWVNQTECRETYGLSVREIAMLPPPRIEKRKYNGRRAKYPTKLYRLDHVLALVERLEAQPGRDARKAKARTAAQKAIQTKIKRLGAELPELVCTLAWPATVEELLDWVWKSLCSRYHDPHEPGLNGVVATIRHEGTNYDQLCVIVYGRVGGQDYYEDFRAEVDGRIEAELRARYPAWYEAAVQRVMEARAAQAAEDAERRAAVLAKSEEALQEIHRQMREVQP